MKNLSNFVAIAGIILFVYAIIGRFVSGPTIGLGIILASAQAGMTAGIGFMLAGLIIGQLKK